MTLEARLPAFVRDNHECHEWRHASAILTQDFPAEWEDLMAVLTEFRLRREWIEVGGGNTSRVAAFIDNFLFRRGPRLDMFARGARPGWTVWGNQADEYMPDWPTYANHSQNNVVKLRP